MFIVGFTGAAGAGKDTAGLSLVRKLGFQRFAFADPIKYAVAAMLAVPFDKWLDREWKEADLDFGAFDITTSPRHLAQTLGTEWGREVIDQDFWIAVTAYRVNQAKRNKVVITDVRFDNEAKWIQASGGWVIEIARPGVQPVRAHESEDGINPNLVDFSIINDGSQDLFELIVAQEIADKMRVRNLL